MKKIIAAGMLAFCVIAISQQQASAWTHTRFGIGLNFDHQSGGNSAFWGLWRNGQPPGPEAFGGGYGPQRFGPAPVGMPPHASFTPQGFAPAPQGYVPPAPPGFAPATYNYNPTYSGQVNYGGPFHLANNPHSGYYYYTMPYYNYGR